MSVPDPGDSLPSAPLATLVMLLGRLASLNEALAAEVCRRHGTTPAELRVLAVLDHFADEGPVRPSRLSRTIVQTSGGLTATLARLEAAGCIERRTDPADRRVRAVALTPEGSERYRVATAELLSQYERALDGIDLAAALATVRALVGALEPAAGTASSAQWRHREAGGPAGRSAVPRP